MTDGDAGGPDDDSGGPDGDSDGPDVFDVASNDTRLAVLEALAAAHSESPRDPWLAYSDLRERVGVRDKGSFNYHLDRLGDLVVAGEAGYRLSRIGMELVSAVASGNFDPDRSWGPVEAPGACRTCGDPLELRYADGILRLTCGVDDHAVPMSVSPALLESHPEDVLFERLAALDNQWPELLRRGVCAECHGRVDGGVARHPEADHYLYDGRCARCGFRHALPVGHYLVAHPAVVAFHHDHGVDVRGEPFWTLPFTEPGAETVVSTDPLRVRVDVTRGDERLALTLDGDGSVVATDRTSEGNA